MTAVIADTLCEQGRFGQKTGSGFYRYENGSRTPTPNPRSNADPRQGAENGHRAPRRSRTEEIIERTLYPLINEGAKILEEGIAARASDIDVVWVNGYGFPVGKGGPMFWAGLEGAGKITERLDHWHRQTGRQVFQVAPRLRRVVETGSWDVQAAG